MNGERWDEIEAFANAPVNRDSVNPKANRSGPVQCAQNAKVDALYERLCGLVNYTPA